MASKMLVWVSAVVLVAVLFMAAFGASYIANPRFTVVNESPMSIVLVVGWDGQEQPYGALGPGQRIKFSVNAEAEMTLLVKYSNDYIVASRPIYLTSGTITKAKVFDTHIEFE